MNTYTIGEFSKKVRKSVRTLQKGFAMACLKQAELRLEEDFISLFSLETKEQSKRTYTCSCDYGQDRDFYASLNIVLKAIEEFKLVVKKALDLL